MPWAKGGAAAHDLSATIDSPHASVLWNGARTVSIAPLAAGASAAGQPFRLTLRFSPPPGATLPFTVVVSAAGSGPWAERLDLPGGCTLPPMPYKYRLPSLNR